MNLNLALLLRERALLRLADMLWNDDYTYRVLSKHHDMPVRFLIEREINHIIDTIILRNISVLSLPGIIINNLLSTINQIAQQKVSWYFVHKYLLNIEKLPSVFYWTHMGNINRKKTAEHLIKDETIDICERYALACFYCLEFDIRDLALRIPYSFKKFSKEYGDGLRNFWNFCMRNYRMEFILDWYSADFQFDSDEEDMDLERAETFWVAEEDENRITCYKEAYYYALKFGNRDAADFFWKKRTLSERSSHERNQETSLLQQIMKKCVHNHGIFESQCKEYYLHTALFLVKRMTECQIMEAFKTDRILTLQFLLHWPFQGMFLEMANFFHDELSTRDVIRVLCCSLWMDKRKYNDFGCYKLFRDYWKILPTSRKEDIISHSIPRIEGLFWALIKAEYAEGILLVLSDMSSTQKEQLMFNNHGKEISTILIEKKEWLLMFVQNITCAEKEKFIIHQNGIHVCCILTSRQKWDLLKLFFDECLPSKPRASINIFKCKLARLLSEESIHHVFCILDIESDT